MGHSCFRQDVFPGRGGFAYDFSRILLRPQSEGLDFLFGTLLAALQDLVKQMRSLIFVDREEARKLGIQEAPSFLVNGVLIRGAVTMNGLKNS